MKLVIKQKVFSWKDKFYVTDDKQNNCYYAEGELFSWGKKLHVYDVHEREVAFIKQRVFSFLPRYEIYENENQIAEVKREFTLFKPRYTVNGLGWQIAGDFWGHEYEIRSNERLIASIHKEWFTWGDCYSIEIADDEQSSRVLSVVLVLDCVMAQDGAAVAASSSGASGS